MGASKSSSEAFLELRLFFLVFSVFHFLASVFLDPIVFLIILGSLSLISSCLCLKSLKGITVQLDSSPVVLPTNLFSSIICKYKRILTSIKI